MYKRIATIISVLFITSGCAVTKVPQPTSGSRSDGTVEMSYQYGQYQNPQVNWQKAKIKAVERCKAWGYSGAEAFGGAMEDCQSTDMYGSCTRATVTKEYQCVGKEDDN